jgi:hypothetical protein
LSETKEGEPERRWKEGFLFSLKTRQSEIRRERQRKETALKPSE